MKKNIIVATDFSQRSFDVISKAFGFAKMNDSVVHVIHIIESGVFDKLTAKVTSSMYEQSFAQVKEKFPNLQKENFHCRHDSLKDGVGRYVKELEAYMVILGSSGQRFHLLGNLLGTNTKSIVRSIDVPCLVVKSSRETLDFQSILVPSDLSNESRKYIHTVHNLFPNALMELLYSYTIPFQGGLAFYGMDRSDIESFQEDIKNNALEESYTFYNSLAIDKKKVTISPVKCVLSYDYFSNYADTKEFDMIAIHTTGRISFFAFDLLEHSQKDVLITKI